MENYIDNLGQNLTKRGFRFSYFETCEEAVSYITSLIPQKSSIGFGGSATVTECGLLDGLQKRDYVLFHRALCKDIPQKEIYKKMRDADWYISSANALCQTGEIVNIDGRGNRVSSILDGPENVIIICGVNKIVPDVSAGIDRTRNIASPKNCLRLGKKTPCAVTGSCSYCNSPDTICKATVIQHHPMTDSTVYVVLINKNLGY
jgi:hypothetical protein